jgi:Domain of unknown function (DUF4168)
MRLLMPPLLVTVLTTAWLLSVPASNAQAPSASPGTSEQAPAIPDQKLDAAAAAIERVANLKENYQQQIAVAPPSDRERIAAEAISALSKAVTDQGLSIDEYNSILEVAQNDPEVGAKIRQRLDPSAK